MKKIMTVLLVLTMLLGLCAPALAVEIIYIAGDGFEPLMTETDGSAYEGDATPSVTYDPQGVVVADGLHLEVRTANPADVNEETLSDTASKAEAIVRVGDMWLLEVVDIVVVRDSDGEVVDWPEPITVTLRCPDWILASFIKEADGSWTELRFENGEEDGVVTLYLPHLTPVAFALPDKRGSESGTGDGIVTSPQTGYDTGLWMALAAAFAVGAAVCLVRGRKKAER